MSTNEPPHLLAVPDVTDPEFDGVVVVTDCLDKLDGPLSSIKAVIDDAAKVDRGISKQPVVIIAPCIPSRRLIYAATGPVNRDQDDVRRFADAAGAGIERAMSAGCRKPLLVVTGSELYTKAVLVAVLGVLQRTYLPIELAEAGKSRKLDKLGVWAAEGNLVQLASALEQGRLVCRDIGGSDPERMAAPRVEEYVKKTFKDSSVKVEVISDGDVLVKDYPLLAAVNRAARVTPRHSARLLFLEYKGKGEITKTLFLVGKGVTYDTGGADIKAGGNMAGMHRDKCGAATVAGFMKVVSLLEPKNVRVVAGLSMVRNSVGEECYVADEIITSRAGVRVRVGNTDAEGRMAMTDVLCRMKELAVGSVNPQMFTIATLTGHAIRAMGPAYSIIMDNGPARKQQSAQKLQEIGHNYGDPFEISTIRREDYDFHAGKSEYEDVLQAGNSPSTMTNRGHQGPAAFMILASGLDKCGVDSATPLAYSHLDIAGSSGPFPGLPTGAPIVALTARFLM